MKLAARSAIALALALSAGACGSSGEIKPQGAPFPPGFVDELVARVAQSTSLATKPGIVRVIDRHGILKRKPALDLSSKTCAEIERGVASVTVDPSFASNRLVYVYYSRERSAFQSSSRREALVRGFLGSRRTS